MTRDDPRWWAARHDIERFLAETVQFIGLILPTLVSLIVLQPPVWLGL